MGSWSVCHHFEEEPATDPSHYETVNKLCIGHGVSLRSTGLNVVTQTRVWVADSTSEPMRETQLVPRSSARRMTSSSDLRARNLAPVVVDEGRVVSPEAVQFNVNP